MKLLSLWSLILMMNWSFLSFKPIMKKSDNLPKCEINYKWEVTGDFDGDGKKETLREWYINSETNEEIELPESKNMNYDSLVSFVVKNNPQVSLVCANSRIPDLHIARTQQLFGICWLNNIGDLDGNGTDEISLVIDWADWSTLNSCKIFTLNNRVWKEIADFQIIEWQMSQLEDETPFDGFIHKDSSGNFYAEEYDLEQGKVIRKIIIE